MLKPDRDDLEFIDLDHSNKEIFHDLNPETYLADRLKLFMSKINAIKTSGYSK